MEFMEKLRNNNNPLLRKVQRQMDSRKKESSLKVSSNKENNLLNGFDVLNEETNILFEEPIKKTKLELYMGRNLGRGGRK